MRRAWLIVAFVLLLSLDARGVIELWERFYVHPRYAVIEQLTGGGVFYWGTWALVVLFDLGVLWLTILVARRLRKSGSAPAAN